VPSIVDKSLKTAKKMVCELTEEFLRKTELNFFASSVKNNSQARSQECQNEEADRSSVPSTPLPSPSLRSRPLKSS